jgi:hypothetical protein
MGKIAGHGWPSVARHTKMCAPRATAAALTAIFAFFVAVPLSVSAQVAARDSGDYNNSTIIYLNARILSGNYSGIYTLQKILIVWRIYEENHHSFNYCANAFFLFF